MGTGPSSGNGKDLLNQAIKKFKEGDTKSIEIMFKQAAAQNKLEPKPGKKPEPEIDRTTFDAYFTMSGSLSGRLFDVFDVDGTGRINMEEFLWGIGLCANAATDKVELFYRLLNTSGKGLSPTDLHKFLATVAKGVRKIQMHKGADVPEQIRPNSAGAYPASKTRGGAVNGKGKKSAVAAAFDGDGYITQAEVDAMVQEAFITEDKDYNALLSLEEFRAWVTRNIQIQRLMEESFSFEVNAQEAFDEALQQYQLAVSDMIRNKLPMDASVVDAKHRTVKERTIGYFTSHSVAADREAWWNKLKNRIREEYKMTQSLNEEASSKFCTNLLKTMYVSSLGKKVSSGGYKRVRDYMTDRQKFLEEYQTKAIGPAAAWVYTTTMDEQLEADIAALAKGFNDVQINELKADLERLEDDTAEAKKEAYNQTVKAINFQDKIRNLEQEVKDQKLQLTEQSKELHLNNGQNTALEAQLRESKLKLKHSEQVREDARLDVDSWQSDLQQRITTETKLRAEVQHLSHENARLKTQNREGCCVVS